MKLTAHKLGYHIPLLRKKAGLSQENLAELSGLSRTAIQGIEAGKESLQIDTLLKVCHVLNIRLSFDHPLLIKEETDAMTGEWDGEK
ncbi:helix-turn-helix domain-containing protein [Candidatus Paracaedibacter symbiosus]|uniref:helix-turn-helix domain-containing protein n=1 Tax=Candidatus Paracaedibacter symbiosus TaxID=244582 RepID=UPI00068AF057|nr:helix-turn-helix domain-containing protein [Candidatus Paracaedibacter symbiosus]